LLLQTTAVAEKHINKIKMVGVDSEHVGAAFGAVFAAGCSTAIGAAVVFFPKLVKLASRRVLASSLGFSAGVMTYVSFVEIFQKSIGHYTDHAKERGYDDNKAEGRGYAFATLSFFGGVAVMMLLDKIVQKLTGSHGHGHPGADNEFGEAAVNDAAPLHCCVGDGVGELQNWQEKADAEIAAQQDGAVDSSNSAPLENSAVVMNGDADEKKRLEKMGLQTAIAIALHNFPEGLATFVAVLDEPQIGIILAIAIGIHNIPEGLCVSLPVYYASGNRTKAFWWGALSGISEPIGAFLGWLVLANSFSDMLYGLMFGLVAGMMIMISFRELLPTAHRYDPSDTVVSYSTVAGMVVMSLSLVLYYF